MKMTTSTSWPGSVAAIGRFESEMESQETLIYAAAVVVVAAAVDVVCFFE